VIVHRLEDVDILDVERGYGRLGCHHGKCLRGRHRSHLGNYRRGSLLRRSKVRGLSHIQVEMRCWRGRLGCMGRLCGLLLRIGVLHHIREFRVDNSE
jgi:hypothetical protein